VERAVAREARVKPKHRTMRTEAAASARDGGGGNRQNAGRKRERGGDRNRLPVWVWHRFCSCEGGRRTTENKTEDRKEKWQSVLCPPSSVLCLWFHIHLSFTLSLSRHYAGTERRFAAHG
jgi:hypothetical protein